MSDPAANPAPAATAATGAVTPPAAEAAPAAAAASITEPAAAKPAVPEKYELKLADGSKLSAQALDEVAAFAKAKGYTNEQAQELLDQKQSAVNGYAEQQQQTLAVMNDTTWKQELMADPEIGGAKFNENAELAYSAAEKWFGKEFAENLKVAKLNHNPSMFRGLVKIAQAAASDKLVLPGQTGGSKPMTEVFYGKPE